MTTDRTAQALRLYRQHRLDDQAQWYDSRRREFNAAARQLASMSAVVLAVAAGVSVLAGASIPGKALWAVLAAVLPAVATTLSAYGSLYAFERQAKIYADALRSLRQLRLTLPHATDADVAAYVDAVEDVLRREQGQWGQLLAELPLAKAPDA